MFQKTLTILLPKSSSTDASFVIQPTNANTTSYDGLPRKDIKICFE